MLELEDTRKNKSEAKSWEFFTNGKHAQDAMLEAIKEAEESIEIEQYIFNNDLTGGAFVEALIKKRKEGLTVRLLCDHVGSFYFFSSSWPGRLRDEGVEVRFFNIINPLRIESFTSWYFRDHRKMMVVDSKIGFIGGVGIADYIHTWRDTHVKIEGEIVGAMQTNFDQIWKKSKHRNVFHFKKWQHRMKKFDLLTNAPQLHERHIYHALIEMIRNAKHSILLTTPYFVPDGRFLRAIRLAAKRGVSIKIILPEVADIPGAKLVANAYVGIALRAGIQIFRYKKSILHAKTAIIDNVWATMGSLNLDNLSFLWNYEGNIESTDKKFIEELHEHFTTDLSHSREVTLAEWQNRPFFDKMLEYISIPIHYFL